jgi:hypothetical protein
MFLITIDQIIRAVPTAWRNQYKGYLNDPNSSHCITSKKLDALDVSYKVGHLVLKEQIDEIIGNTFWTYLTCSECGKDVKAVVSLEESGADAYGRSAEDKWICQECLQHALNLFD